MSHLRDSFRKLSNATLLCSLRVKMSNHAGVKKSARKQKKELSKIENGSPKNTGGIILLFCSCCNTPTKTIPPKGCQLRNMAPSSFLLAMLALLLSYQPAPALSKIVVLSPHENEVRWGETPAFTFGFASACIEDQPCRNPRSKLK